MLREFNNGYLKPKIINRSMFVLSTIVLKILAFSLSLADLLYNIAEFSYHCMVAGLRCAPIMYRLRICIEKTLAANSYQIVWLRCH